jgi:hypothetical protein
MTAEDRGKPMTSSRVRVLHKLWLAAAAVVLALPTPAPAAPALQPLGRTPLSFEANQGQVPSPASFVARGPGYQVRLGPSEALLLLGNSTAGADASVLRMRLVGGQAPSLEGQQPLAGRVNSFVGSDPARWRTGIPTFRKVQAAGVYPGIDLIYYGDERRLEYDFIVAPGADPRGIALAFEDVYPSAVAAPVSVEATGDLVVRTGGRDLRLRKPVAYQDRGGQRQEIAVRYAVRSTGGGALVGFDVGPYDSTRTLVIDPVVEAVVYLGGSQVDSGNAIAAGDGTVYVTGHTTSTDFPPSPKPAGHDVFVTKLDAAGQVLQTTYLGGNGNDTGRGIALDAQGRVHVVGTTGSTNFPTPNGFKTSPRATNDTDAFVAVLNAAGALVWATYLGGAGADTGQAVAVDGAGKTYVTGILESDGPSTDGTTLQGTSDAFAAKLDSGASGAASLVYFTHLGGTGADEGQGIDVDSLGAAYVVGATESADFPTTASAFRLTLSGTRDAFVTKLGPDGHTRAYSTYFGGSGEDTALAVSVYLDALAAVTGRTTSADMPVSSAAFQAAPGGGTDAFVLMINTTRVGRRSRGYSSYLGGQGRDEGLAVAVNANRRIYITGLTDSADFPLSEPAGAPVGTDAFLVEAFLELSGPDSLVSSTRYGGSGDDEGRGVAIDVNGVVFLTGRTTSPDLPGVPGTLGGSQDAFVGRLGDADLTVTVFEGAPASALQGESIVVRATVKNIGALPAPASQLSFSVRPTDRSAPATLMEILSNGGATSMPVPVLGPGESFATGDVNIRVPGTPAGPRSGSHYLSAIADSTDLISELREDNNRRRVRMEIRRDGPDLTPTALGFSSRTVQGKSLQLRYTIANIGNEPSDPTTITFLLSTTTSAGGQVAELGSKAVPAIAKASAHADDLTVQIPLAVASREYFVLARVNLDPKEERDEDFENNQRSKRLRVGADLSLLRLVATPTATGLSIYDETLNAIEGPAAASVTGFHLSTTPNLDGSLGKLGERSIPAFTGRARNKARPPAGPTVVPLPAGLASGTYYVVGRADDGNAVDEIDETNNLLATAIQVASDLIVSRLFIRNATADPPALTPEQAFTLTNAVRNQGLASSAASTIEFKFGATCGGATTSLGSRAVGALAPGALADRQDTVLTLPAGVAPGSYCLTGTVADTVTPGNNQLSIPFVVN